MSELSFNLTNRIKLTNPNSNIDVDYGPYISIEDACLGVLQVIRDKGKTVGIIESGTINEYWWKSGIEDSDLVLKSVSVIGTIGIDIDGHGKSISQGLKGYIIIPYDCVINNWYIISDKIGSIEIDVWKATNSIPTNLNSVTNSEKIKLQQEQINSNSTELWNNNIYTGDIIAFNVDNVVDINKVNVILKVSKI